MSDAMGEFARLLGEMRSEMSAMRAEMARIRGAGPEVPGATQQTLAFPIPPPAEQLVTLDQMAALVKLQKRSLERYRGALPPPKVPGGGGRAARWAWADVRPWLEEKFGRPLPESFPAFAAG